MQLKGFDAAHYRRTEAYARQIDKLCSLAAADYASLAGTLFQPDQSKPFSFDDYPRARKEAQQIINGLAKKIEGVVVRGIEPLKTKDNIRNIYYCISIRYKHFYFSFVLLKCLFLPLGC